MGNGDYDRTFRLWTPHDAHRGALGLLISATRRQLAHSKRRRFPTVEDGNASKHFPAASPPRQGGKPQMRDSGPRRRQTCGEKGVVVELIDRCLPSAQPQRLTTTFTSTTLEEVKINDTCGAYPPGYRPSVKGLRRDPGSHASFSIEKSFNGSKITTAKPLTTGDHLFLERASKQSTRHKHE